MQAERTAAVAERTAAVAARHGLVLVLDWIDELVARHGLQMRGG